MRYENTEPKVLAATCRDIVFEFFHGLSGFYGSEISVNCLERSVFQSHSPVRPGKKDACPGLPPAMILSFRETVHEAKETSPF